MYSAMDNMLNNTVDGFGKQVEHLVCRIPHGRVMTYGQIAALCGSPRAARIVGGTAHYGNPELPWQRVVNKYGGLATGYPGGQAAHARALSAEDIVISNDYTVNVSILLWWPPDAAEAIVGCDSRETM